MLTLNDGRKELYQWDTGRTATVDIECDIVHFANLKYGESLAVEVKGGKVAIPNKLLMILAIRGVATLKVVAVPAMRAKTARRSMKRPGVAITI